MANTWQALLDLQRVRNSSTAHMTVSFWVWLCPAAYADMHTGRYQRSRLLLTQHVLLSLSFISHPTPPACQSKAPNAPLGLGVTNAGLAVLGWLLLGAGALGVQPAINRVPELNPMAARRKMCGMCRRKGGVVPVAMAALGGPGGAKESLRGSAVVGTVSEATGKAAEAVRLPSAQSTIRSPPSPSATAVTAQPSPVCGTHDSVSVAKERPIVTVRRCIFCAGAHTLRHPARDARPSAQGRARLRRGHPAGV